jgi:hypothetical protein
LQSGKSIVCSACIPTLQTPCVLINHALYHWCLRRLPPPPFLTRQLWGPLEPAKSILLFVLQGSEVRNPHEKTSNQQLFHPPNETKKMDPTSINPLSGEPTVRLDKRSTTPRQPDTTPSPDGAPPSSPRADSRPSSTTPTPHQPDTTPGPDGTPPSSPRADGTLSFTTLTPRQPDTTPGPHGAPPSSLCADSVPSSAIPTPCQPDSVPLSSPRADGVPSSTILYPDNTPGPDGVPLSSPRAEGRSTSTEPEGGPAVTQIVMRVKEKLPTTRKSNPRRTLERFHGSGARS